MLIAFIINGMALLAADDQNPCYVVLRQPAHSREEVLLRDL